MGYMNEFPHTRMFDSDLREILEMYNTVKGLPNDWETFKKTMTTDWAELKNFVNSFFRDLDVQNEINTKIDALVADGTMEEVIRPIFESYNAEMNVLKARVNALSKLGEGSTTGDAELVDARIDKDGNTHTNVGEHIRTVTSQLSSEIEAISDLKKIEQGGWRSISDGTICTNPSDTRCRSIITNLTENFASYNVQSGYAISITQVDENNIILNDTGWVSGKGTLNYKNGVKKLYVSIKKEDESLIIPSDVINAEIYVYTSVITSISILENDMLVLCEMYESDYVDTSKVVLIETNIKSGNKYKVINNTGNTCTVNTSNDGTTNLESFGYIDNEQSVVIEPTQDAKYIRSYCNGATGGTIIVKNIMTELGKAETDIERLKSAVKNASGEYDFVSSRNALNDIDEKLLSYSENISKSTDFDTFLFFTDPHTFQHEVNEIEMQKSIGNIENVFNNSCADFVMCGGDWLQNSDTPTEAIMKLGRIDGIMRGKFKDKYYPILGNHDTNYQGIDENGNENSGTINQKTLLNLWFREYGNLYYNFKTNLGTRFYVFDTGTDWVSNMTDYRWEQCKWFASELIDKDDLHSVIALHILTIQSISEVENGLAPQELAKNVLLIAQAYNNKTTIVVNGTSYDFAQTKGKVAFLICGHSHYDKMLTHLDIPIVMTVNSTYDSDIDLCLIDYSNSKFKTVRIGNGENRDMDIIS